MSITCHGNHWFTFLRLVVSWCWLDDLATLKEPLVIKLRIIFRQTANLQAVWDHQCRKQVSMQFLVRHWRDCRSVSQRKKRTENLYLQVRWCKRIVLELCRLDKVEMNKFRTCGLNSWVLPWSLCRWLKSLWTGRRPYRSTVAVRPPCLHIQRFWHLPPLPSLPKCTHPEKSRGQEKYDIHTLNNEHELAHLPLPMMTIFSGSNNASFGVGEVKLSGWHSSPSL